MTYWVLVFAMFMPDGHVHVNKIHGYNTKGACEADAQAYRRQYDVLRTGCVSEYLTDKDRYVK